MGDSFSGLLRDETVCSQSRAALCLCSKGNISNLTTQTLRQDSHFSKVILGVCLSTSYLAGYLKNDSEDVDGIYLKHYIHL